ncbi:MAG: hypothetical protein ACRDQA_08735, partial [Nocardioidaceae bacterium]
MTSIDDVLERLVNDPAFRDQLTTERKTALAGYELSDDDLDVLESTLSADAGDEGHMEGRQSKSALMGAVGAIVESGQALAGSDGTNQVPSGPSGQPVAQPPDPVFVDNQPDSGGVDTQSDSVVEDTQSDPVAADTQPDPVAADTQPDPVAADTESEVFTVTRPDPVVLDSESDPAGADTESDPVAADTESEVFTVTRP